MRFRIAFLKAECSFIEKDAKDKGTLKMELLKNVIRNIISNF